MSSEGGVSQHAGSQRPILDPEPYLAIRHLSFAFRALSAISKGLFYYRLEIFK